MKTINPALMVLLVLAAVIFAQPAAQWQDQFPPFKIAGNLYYVGTADLAVYLITTPQGNIVINSDFEEDVPTVRKNIEQLGFRYGETKILLMSHAHADHDGGIGIIQRQTGAKLMVMEGDVAEVESRNYGRPGARVDRVLHDGDVVELGGSKLVARLTAGHTEGCTTWTMQVEDGGQILNAVIIGSVNVNAGYALVGNDEYPRIAEDYVKSFALLKSLPVDLFLGAHGGYFGMKSKYEIMKKGGANPFIDPTGYRAYIADREANFRREWERQKQGSGLFRRG